MLTNSNVIKFAFAVAFYLLTSSFHSTTTVVNGTSRYYTRLPQPRTHPSSAAITPTRQPTHSFFLSFFFFCGSLALIIYRVIDTFKDWEKEDSEREREGKIYETDRSLISPSPILTLSSHVTS